MLTKRNNQFGYGPAETLALVAVLVIVAVVGWAVYKHQQKPTSNSIITSTSQNNTQDNTQAQNQNKKNEDTTPYVTIKEWGVRAPYLGSLTLTYTISSDGKSAVFSSNQLTAASSSCTGRGGAILRWASTDKVTAVPADPNAPTATQYFANQPASSYTHIGNYYYSFKHDSSACGDPNSTAVLSAQTNNDVQALVPKLQDVPTN